MIRRPTPLPLTKTERDALAGLILRGARALSPAEGNYLLRLLQLDQAERLQERRTARGLSKQNRELWRRVKAAENGQVLQERDDAVGQLQAAEQELGARRTCEASALAVLAGWGAAGPEADLMRREIRRTLLLASAGATNSAPVQNPA